MSFQHTRLIIKAGFFFDEHQETSVQLLSEGYVGHHIWYLQNLKAATIIQVNDYDVFQTKQDDAPLLNPKDVQIMPKILSYTIAVLVNYFEECP